MKLETKAATLLTDWQTYKNVQCSSKTHFTNAVDIEIEKDSMAQMAKCLLEGLTDNNVSRNDLRHRTTTFEDKLHTFKDRITFELLKNGN